MGIWQFLQFGWRRMGDLSTLGWLWSVLPTGLTIAASGYFASFFHSPLVVILFALGCGTFVFISTLALFAHFTVEKKNKPETPPLEFIRCAIEAVADKVDDPLAKHTREFVVYFKNASQQSLTGVEIMAVDAVPEDGSAPLSLNVSLNARKTINGGEEIRYVITTSLNMASLLEGQNGDYVVYHNRCEMGKVQDYKTIGSFTLENKPYRLRIRYSAKQSPSQEVLFIIELREMERIVRFERVENDNL